MKPAVRQVKGPGMNLGRKKLRKIPAQPKPISEPKISSAEPSSYLPQQALAKGGRVQAMKNGKGKVISCQNY